MSSTRELLQKVDSTLATADESRSDQLQQLAERVEFATARLAEKVGKCETLWRQGRFDEARQAARRGEDIREEAELATFKAADAWSSWCRRLGAPIPVPVEKQKLHFVLERLNAGPSKHEQMLREFRRMALGRAPLIDRLRMLRVMAKTDPDNAAWLDDVRAFEQVRHDELARLFREAEKRGDVVQLRTLKSELASDPWLIPPPPRLLPAVEVALAPLESRAAEQRYESLSDDLRNAHAALDGARCRKVLEEWAALEASTRVAPPPTCARDLEPVRAWLRDVDQQREADRTFETACAALESALDSGASLEDIERLASAVLRLERGMPQVLGTRTASRMEELRSGRRARYVLKLAGVLAGAVVMGGIVAASWNYQTRVASVERWSGQIGAALAGEDLAAARKLMIELERADAVVYQAAEIRDLEAKLLAREQAESERVGAFAASIATVETAGVAHLDFEAFLKRAEALARSTPERALIEEWRHRRVVHRDEQQRYRDQVLAPELEKLALDYEALREASARNAADVQERASACIEVARRLSSSGDASPRLRERAATILTGTETLLQQALSQSERQQQIAQALEKLQRTIEADELAVALMAFSRSFPDHPRATDFVKAASALEQWRAVSAWRSLLVGMGTSIHVESGTVAAERRKALEAYRAAHPLTPYSDDVQRLLTYFSGAEQALGEGGVAGLDVLRSVLDSPLIAGSFTVDDREGRRYYLLDDTLPQQPQRPGVPAVYSFEYVVNARLVTRKKVWNTQTEGVEAVARRSPQSRFAEAAQRILGSPRDSAWEILYLKLLEAALAQEGMDPILATSLVRLLAELGKTVVPFAAEDLEPFERELKNIRVEVAWMDPEETDNQPSRTRARAALDRLPAVRPLIERIEAKLRRPLVLWPVGVLIREIKPVQGGATRGDLYVVLGNPPELRRVGRLANGTVQVEGTGLSAVPHGTLVFATNDSGEGR